MAAMRSSGVRWVVVGGIVALSVIWLGIRPGRRATRPVATIDSAAESAGHSAAPVAPAERREASSEEARAVAPADPIPAPTAGVRPPRRAGGAARAAATPTGDVDMNLNPPDDIPTLGRMALTDPDPQRRAEAGVLLAATENPGVVPLLRQALSDRDANVRHTLVKEIAELDFAPDTTIDLLGPVAMKDSESGNRVAALEALAAIGGDRVIALATRLRRDRDQDVRVLAEKILHPPAEGAASGPE